MKKYLLPVLFLFSAIMSFSQTAEKDGIAKAIQAGNSKTLGTYFTSSVDLTVKDAENVYSKEQAEVVMTRFFNESKPQNFSVKHEGKSKLDDYYYIGDLNTTTGLYRLTFFLKKDGSTFKIKQLRIENTN